MKELEQSQSSICDLSRIPRTAVFDLPVPGGAKKRVGLRRYLDSKLPRGRSSKIRPSTRPPACVRGGARAAMVVCVCVCLLLGGGQMSGLPMGDEPSPREDDWLLLPDSSGGIVGLKICIHRGLERPAGRGRAGGRAGPSVHGIRANPCTQQLSNGRSGPCQPRSERY